MCRKRLQNHKATPKSHTKSHTRKCGFYGFLCDFVAFYKKKGHTKSHTKGHKSHTPKLQFYLWHFVWLLEKLRLFCWSKSHKKSHNIKATQKATQKATHQTVAFTAFCVALWHFLPFFGIFEPSANVFGFCRIAATCCVNAFLLEIQLIMRPQRISRAMITCNCDSKCH